ncbi:uncharacterized protein EI97DRAFT_437004 [Westerdykella ornata]|uniref:Pentatricopeptide repeat domain-containing protein n=1 Tax=Westerdykella ornata TaxID=318751 RepID=A0A6A6J810_WESOR|nr:uncharacterized protein EI97DRAFT_437004 [Westerdykella ornata]KAF2272377.1 hypothetical protein EI97DRAFT_437004 [Westerdykella ornata]
MPAALDRLLNRPAALRVLVAQRFLAASSYRCYSSDTGSSNSNEDVQSDVRDSIDIDRRYKNLNPRGSKFSDETKILDRWHPARIAQAPKEEQAVLWAQLLAYQHRLQGLDGIKEVYFMMLHTGYRIPTADTREARAIWGTLFKNAQIVLRVIDYAAHYYDETGQVYPHLYELCMGRWLRKNPEFAMNIHHRLVHKLRLRKLPLRALAQIAKPTRDEATLSTFMDIYRSSSEVDVYDEIVPVLCDQGEITLARRWHFMCTHRKDLPSPSAASHPIVQLFIAEFSSISSPDPISLIRADQGTIARHLDLPSSPARPKKSKLNHELMRRLEGRDTAPIRFDDPFCARLFATKAISPASVIKGLILAGVNEIGPVALRQMGLRTDPITELPERFRELKEGGIALHGCVFSLALEKFAMEGRFGLVRSLLRCDQHPDVFDDAKVQKELLNEYLEEDDRMQAHRTLAILALFHQDVSTESWNLLLQARIKRFHPTQVVKTLEDMRDHGVLLSEDSFKALKTILRRRRRHRLPDVSVPGQVDDLRFLARCYILILESGIGVVFPVAWTELIRRFGLYGRLRELQRLLIWLLCWYAPRDNPVFAHLPKSPFLDSATAKVRQAFPEQWHTIDRLFGKNFQRAIVVWGFRFSFATNATYEQSMLSRVAAKKHHRLRFLRKGILRRLDWAAGLRILVALRDRGVPIFEDALRRTLHTQFGVMFRTGPLLKRYNRVVREKNRLRLSAYKRKVNEIWGSPLYREVVTGADDGTLEGVQSSDTNEAGVSEGLDNVPQEREGSVVGPLSVPEERDGPAATQAPRSGLEEVEELCRKQSRRR